MKGLTYIPSIISEKEEFNLIKQIESSEWDESLKRLTQHYGYKYNYYSPHKATKTIEIPDWLLELIKTLKKRKLIDFVPNQIIINRYLIGEGIAPHIDSDIFGDTIVSLSLGSGCNFEFCNGKEYIIYYLESRSGLIMKNEARYNYTHSISKNKTDLVNKKRIKRKTRYSITFRNYKYN